MSSVGISQSGYAICIDCMHNTSRCLIRYCKVRVIMLRVDNDTAVTILRDSRLSENKTTFFINHLNST